MSSLIVEVCEVEEVKEHPNADRLDLVRVKNWWTVESKGKHQVGNKVVYLPPDSVISEDLAKRWGIANYCGIMPKNLDGTRPEGLRIMAARLRGEPSFGCVQEMDDPSWEVGKDVKEHYGIVKYNPPERFSAGDVLKSLPEFHEYTGIENIGNFPEILESGEEVIVTEKIHGSNSRVGYVLNEEGSMEYMAGSYSTRRKEFDNEGKRSNYWVPFKEDGKLKALLKDVYEQENALRAVLLFGEIFGPSVQDMQYGQKTVDHRAFDISVDGKYLDYDKLERYLTKYSIEAVPVLYRGPFSMDKMNELVDGPTTICDASDIKEKFKGREGVVITPVKERYNFDIGGSGRVKLKYISVDYHGRKNKNRTENH